jgi:hypothetical protein
MPSTETMRTTASRGVARSGISSGASSFIMR